MKLSDLLGAENNHFYWLLDTFFNLASGLKINLGKNNPDLQSHDILTMKDLEHYIDSQLRESGRKFAFGGYGEHREFYKRSPIFLQGEPRVVHLGMDFWLPAYSTVYLPMDGTIHSFASNSGTGNYGPTLITEHQLNNHSFFLLFGHLSHTSLEKTKIGAVMRKGSVIGKLGDYEENGNWPPHLHFQIINDLKGNWGDYPGVATVKVSIDEMKNCPDPTIIFNL
jgi:murein DD-endopeptidase MepM/ murein hydrolase activator NlpD